MKYIKKFNESSNMLYSEITSGEYEIGIRKKVIFNDKYYDKISNLVNDGCDVESYSSFIEIIIEDTIITICELEDEWFHVRWLSDGYTTYFKCDQFEGLIKFLKNKSVIE